MYIVQWDADRQLLEANLAGAVTPGEATAFLDDVREALTKVAHTGFAFVLDAGRAKLSEASVTAIEDARTMAIFAGAARLRCILDDEDTLVNQIEQNFDAVLQGTEVYELRAA